METLLNTVTRPIGAVVMTHRLYVFKGIAARADSWLLCTRRAVVWVDCAGQVERVWSALSLNDAHHAIEHDGALWVANTGLDAVLEVRAEEIRPMAWRACGPRARPPHPRPPSPRGVNHLWLWRVRCGSYLHEGGVRRVGTKERIRVAPERIHDGVCHDGLVWFTTVNGCLVAMNGHGEVVQTVSLVETADGDAPLGWCRGLAISEGVAWVGFSPAWTPASSFGLDTRRDAWLAGGDSPPVSW